MLEARYKYNGTHYNYTGIPLILEVEKVTNKNCEGNSEPGGSRTHNRYIRSVVLYPIELQVQEVLTKISNKPSIKNNICAKLEKNLALFSKSTM